MTPLELNAYELVLLLLAAGLIYAVTIACDRHWFRNAILVLCIVPALFLALEGGTELLTYDETYMVREVANLRNVTARQWEYHNYRTSLTITGNIITLLRPVLAKNDMQAAMLAKSIHWLLGIGILCGIFWAMNRHWIPPNLFPEFFLIFFYSALLLPTNILSLKVANYDMLAMMLGIWGIICSLNGCEKVAAIASNRRGKSVTKPESWRSFLVEVFCPDGGLTLFGLILTTLATQEKAIAGPFLNLAIVLSVLMRVRRRGRIDWWLPTQIGICVLTVSLILLATYGLVALWHPAQLPRFDLATAWAFLLIHFYIVLGAIGVSEPTLLEAAGLLLLTIGLAPLLWRLGSFCLTRIQATTRIAFLLLLIIAVIVGALSFYTLNVYMHPSYPVPPGCYMPNDEWNGEIIHFLSRTRFEHFLNKTGMAYSIFAISLPSVVVLVAILILASSIRKKEPAAIQGSLLGFEVIAFLSLGMPLVHVFTKTSVGARYFNIWIFTQVLTLGLLACPLLANWRRWQRSMILSIFCLLLIVELLPFRPVVGAFWPSWANASHLSAAKRVEPGRLLIVWSGWGEEAMVAGRWLRQKARAGELPSKSFRLFTAEQGRWLQQDPSYASFIISSAPQLSFTENDYYLVNRAAIMAIDFDFLRAEKPVWVLEYRGVPEAWLYRGSDLKKNN